MFLFLIPLLVFLSKLLILDFISFKYMYTYIYMYFFVSVYILKIIMLLIYYMLFYNYLRKYGSLIIYMRTVAINE